MVASLVPSLPSMKEESSDSSSDDKFRPSGKLVAFFRSLYQWTLYFKSCVPVLRNIHFNFIFCHFLYVMSWTIVGSVVIYPAKNIRYIDALFFASGSATQSGLNPVDMNQLYLYQQITLYAISMFTTPIFIHSALVFFRLYCFEQRFEHIVQDAKALRRTRSRAITFTKSRDQPDLDNEERGVQNRPIVVLRNSVGDAREGNMSHPVVKTPDGSSSGRGDSIAEASRRSSRDSSGTQRASEDGQHGDGHHSHHGLRLGLGSLRVPTQLSPEHHIAFLEKQRKNKGASLRIPSPREYDRGGHPESVDMVPEEEEGEEKEQEGASTPQSDQGGALENQPSLEDEEESSESGLSAVRPENHRIMFSEPDLTRTRSDSSIDRAEARGRWEPPPRKRGIRRARPIRLMHSTLTQEKDRSTLPYLSWNATVGRNSRFIDLTEEQRNELGGIEYRSLKTLAVVLISYYFFFHVFGLVSLVGWIMCNRWGAVIKQDGIGRPWWGIFTAQSAFNDVGFALTPDSMESFQSAIWPLLLISFLILVGNTAFPIMLRFIIWTISKTILSGSALWEELRFLLDHPRRCFTLLFPRNATWWLFVILIVLNVFDWVIFIILDVS